MSKDIALKSVRSKLINQTTKKVKLGGLMKIKMTNQLVQGKRGGASNMHWLLDSSGSMRGERMDQLKTTVWDMLPKYPNVRLVEFSNGARRISEERVPHLIADGGTDMLEALEMAWTAGADWIVLVTDGHPTDATQEEIIQKAMMYDVPISCLGMGRDYDRQFLQTLADVTGGLVAEVGDEELHLLADGLEEILQIEHNPGDGGGTINL